MGVYRCADDPEFAIQVDDGGDHVALTPRICAGGQNVVEFTVALRGRAIRELIAELTAIADVRNL